MVLLVLFRFGCGRGVVSVGVVVGGVADSGGECCVVDVVWLVWLVWLLCLLMWLWLLPWEMIWVWLLLPLLLMWVLVIWLRVLL